MSTQMVEYVIRVRIAEPPDRQDVPVENRIGEAMADIFGLIEELATDHEIVARTVLAGPDRPSRVRCAGRSPDPTRHYATTRRWQVRTPDGETVTVCSAACALGWFCYALPADIEPRHSVPPAEAA